MQPPAEQHNLTGRWLDTAVLK